MKRTICVLLSFVLLLGVSGCGDSQSPTADSSAPVQSVAPEDYVPLEPLTYTELPTALKAEKLGTIQHEEVMIADGGLYYKKDAMYGIMTFDGKVDTGVIYAVCQPKGHYFAVSKQLPDASGDITANNVVGLVDALGREIVPMQYASVELMGSRFARAAELTGTTENEEEKLTQVTIDDKLVMCTGNWYIYDLQTGEKVVGATGTKPYISFDCGGYVKYVLDDKTAITATPDGKSIPNDVLHLNNGHYAIQAERTVYTSDGNKLFTYKEDGYVPVDSKGFDGYILAKKEETYVLLDLTGKVVSAEFSQKPQQYGELFHVGRELVTLQGDVVVEDSDLVLWESLYGQSWSVVNADVTRVVDKTGRVVFENKATDSEIDSSYMMAFKAGSGTRYYYSAKDKGFTIDGAGIAPYIVKKPRSDAGYDLVSVLTGEALLSGYSNYTVADADKTMLYVYARKADKTLEVFVLR